MVPFTSWDSPWARNSHSATIILLIFAAWHSSHMGAWTWGICSIPQFMVILKGDGFSQSFVVCLSQCLEKATVRYVWVVFGAQDLSYILPGVPQPITKSRWGSGDASVTSEKSRKGLSFQVIWIPQNLGRIIVFFAKEAIRILDAGRLVTYIYILIYIHTTENPKPKHTFWLLGQLWIITAMAGKMSLL